MAKYFKSETKTLIIKVEFNAGHDIVLEPLKIKLENVGTINSITQDGNSGDIFVIRNGVILSAPFDTVLGDELDFYRTDDSVEGYIHLTGTHP